MGNAYHDKAAELHAQAQSAPNERLRAAFETLALAYLRLAVQADRNAKSNIVYEAGPARPTIQ